MTFPADCAARYRPVKRLAQGGFGTVWSATQIDLDRPVAIKLLDAPGDAQALARFHREARVTAQLDHPHVVRVIDHGCETGAAWMALEFVEGASLRQRLDAGPIEPALALEIAAQVADGLAAAHAAGVLHRDVKPENVLEAAGQTFKVADFGIATFASAETSIQTASGVVLGTPAYIAPEQINGDDATPASDLYALGCMLFELLTGRTPFQGNHLSAILDAHLGRTPPPAGVSPAVDRLVAQLMAKDPAARPDAAAQVREQLRALAAEDIGPRPQRVVARKSVPSGAVRTVASGVSKRTAPVSLVTIAAPQVSAGSGLAARTVVVAVVIGILGAGAFALRPKPVPTPSPSVSASASAPPVEPSYGPGTPTSPWAGTPLAAAAADYEGLLLRRRASIEKDDKWMTKLANLVGSGEIGFFAEGDDDKIAPECERIRDATVTDLRHMTQIVERVTKAVSGSTARAAIELHAVALGVQLVLWHQAQLIQARLAMLKNIRAAEKLDGGKRGRYVDLPDGAQIFQRFNSRMLLVLRMMPPRPAPLTHADVRFLNQCDSVALYTGRAIEHSAANVELLAGAKVELAALHVLAESSDLAALVESLFLLHAHRKPDGGIRALDKLEARALALKCREAFAALKVRIPESTELDIVVRRFEKAKWK